MADNVAADQFAVFRIEGMHCHKCEQKIQLALSKHKGVREVEVDFASGQASVLFDRDSVSVKELMEAINGAGYTATGFNLGQAAIATGSTAGSQAGGSTGSSTGSAAGGPMGSQSSVQSGGKAGAKRGGPVTD
ncbi:hypothetical protein BH09PLA1_BH09PLA1_13480 [soil metagenome]